MKYDELVRRVAGRTALTRRAADELLVATLTVLAENLTPDETRDLLAQLPKSMKQRVPATSQPVAMRPIEFVARVADLRGGGDLDETETAVRAVVETLTEAVNAGQIRDVVEQLGAEYAEWFGRVARAEPTAAPSQPFGAAASVGRETLQRGSERLLVFGARGSELTNAVLRTAAGSVVASGRLARRGVGAALGAATGAARIAQRRSRDAAAVAVDKVEDATDALDDTAERLEDRFRRRAGAGS